MFVETTHRRCKIVFDAILAKLIFFPEKLKFNPPPQNAFLELHSNSKVHCRADAELKPLVRWIKDGSIKLPHHVRDKEGTLHFHNVRNSDSGYYTCVAHSATQGFINATIYVRVVGELLVFPK